ncbi:MAG: hypothetical protein VBE63_02165 [Lamprobacter sp.]|uniref:hypothetical protein n=1 Tax=Lamprobacter sp. TaxID=3100796 RepID=UPI002B261269|nr:hypothetical protein [Lamprobacter sp.]MEA3638731.1 hypothetical protein [Lamprobacter sp.]
MSIIDPLNPKPEQIKALLQAENHRLERKRYHSDSNACRTMQAMVDQLTPKAATAPPELRTLLEEQLEQVRENCGGWGDHAMPWRILAEAAYVLGLIEKGELKKANPVFARWGLEGKAPRVQYAQQWYLEKRQQWRREGKGELSKAEAARQLGPIMHRAPSTIEPWLYEVKD